MQKNTRLSGTVDPTRIWKAVDDLRFWTITSAGASYGSLKENSKRIIVHIGVLVVAK